MKNITTIGRNTGLSMNLGTTTVPALMALTVPGRMDLMGRGLVPMGRTAEGPDAGRGRSRPSRSRTGTACWA